MANSNEEKLSYLHTHTCHEGVAKQPRSLRRLINSASENLTTREQAIALELSSITDTLRRCFQRLYKRYR